MPLSWRLSEMSCERRYNWASRRLGTSFKMPRNELQVAPKTSFRITTCLCPHQKIQFSSEVEAFAPDNLRKTAKPKPLVSKFSINWIYLENTTHGVCCVLLHNQIMSKTQKGSTNIIFINKISQSQTWSGFKSLSIRRVSVDSRFYNSHLNKFGYL